ncbi:MAG: protein translocase subunit SecF [Candidatus Aminicenantaceae bacterium]
MKYKHIALAVSGLIILTGLINITVGRGINYGIDFAGGTMVRMIFRDQVSVADIRGDLRNTGVENSRIQEVGQSGREYIIRTYQEEAEEISEEEMEAHEYVAQLVVDAMRNEKEKSAIAQGLPDLNSIDESFLTDLLQPEFPGRAEELSQRIVSLRNSAELEGIIQNYSQLGEMAGLSQEVISYLENNTFLSHFAVLSKETVGPQIGHDLRRKATQATIWALLGMLIYIGIRFQYAYGFSAIFTLAHDVLITMGIFSLTNRELNLPVIAAILTLVGYSLNDTIVIFDRVRDNIKLLRKADFQSLLNTSVNQTLSRTLVTSGTTFLTVATLFVFGGEVINDFAFTMMIGVVVGTYSSIYLSCTILYFWKILFKPKKGLGK